MRDFDYQLSRERQNAIAQEEIVKREEAMLREELGALAAGEAGRTDVMAQHLTRGDELAREIKALVKWQRPQSAPPDEAMPASFNVYRDVTGVVANAVLDAVRAPVKIEISIADHTVGEIVREAVTGRQQRAFND